VDFRDNPNSTLFNQSFHTPVINFSSGLWGSGRLLYDNPALHDPYRTSIIGSFSGISER
jgi:hypothetical protein